MYLGIDIGTSYTKIACLSEEGLFDIKFDELLIPTAAAYLPSTGRLYFGNLALRLDEPGTDTVFFFKLDLKRHLDFQLGPYKLSEVIEEFIAFLYSEYISKNLLDITNVTLSIPNYFGLKARQILLNAARKVFGNADIYLFPEPPAALIAYNTINPETQLNGTILSIDVGGGTTDFSFLDAASDLQEVLLESQFQIGFDAFSGSELDHGIIRNIFLPLYKIQTGQSIPEKYITGKSISTKDRQIYNRWLLEAEKLKIEISKFRAVHLYIADFYQGQSISSYINEDMFLNYLEPIYNKLKIYCGSFLKEKASSLGLFAGQKWQIDSILLQGGGSCASGIQQIIAEYFPDIPVTTNYTAALVAKGLCYWHSSFHENSIRLKTIYPFEFYQELHDNCDDSIKLEKIPFDTANLELDIMGRYKIYSVPHTSFSAGQDYLKIFEVAQGEADIVQERFLGMEPVLYVEALGKHTAEDINIFLNMQLCCLETDSGFSEEPSWSDAPIFRNILSKQVESLDLIKSYKYINPQLVKDFDLHLEKQKFYANMPYINHDQTTRYKLLCLLQILDSKINL